ncbi:B12-binding domain-containing radical SAM protein [Geopsychrobacter electrodiphilus]|uniref:B12-binding domain-containing radical SAM protein n=1 Tax=Geopsychrobacter electrodiphilus TaxID=225196 RepID=UPI000361303B|nr:B12-binding domain-containing radical SAM protein [Geopsychrobacter electrodiphilus]
MTDILLLQPPALKPAEPPLALAVLLAHLRAEGLQARALDANLDAYLYLLDGERLTLQAKGVAETNLSRALRHRTASLALLRSAGAVQNFSRYNTAVRYLNRLLALWNSPCGAERLTLGDYQHAGLSPFAPEDLERIASGASPSLFADYFNQELLPRICAVQPRIIAISINYLHQALPAFELAGLLRRALPEVLLVAGGGLISSWREPLRRLGLRLPIFDHLVFGPGETALARLGHDAAGADYLLQDATTIGFAPDFSFARLSDYFSPQPILPLTASRGCYWQRCLFCPEAAAPVHAYTAARPAELPALMRQLADTYGIRHIQLTDNAIPVNMLKVLAEHAAELSDLNWFGFVRFEAALEDADFVASLAKSGCRMLQLGLESGSQAVLDRLGKGVRLETAARILTNLAAAGIASFVYIMLGTPGETEHDAELTLNFLEQHAARIGFLNLSIMNLPRASGLLDNPELYGISSTDPIGDHRPLGLYQKFTAETGWDRSAARRFLDQRLLGSQSIRKIVNRTPPLFTSNHAVFFSSSSRL